MSEFSEITTRILSLYRARSWQIATAESCTGGMVSAALTEIAGSSNVFDRGFVTYSNHAKMAMLEVQAATLDAFGAVSEEVAAEMANGARNASSADVAVSITGIAGPGASRFKPEGRVCFGLSRADTATFCETVEFGAIGRENVRKAATLHALALLEKATGIALA